MSEGIRLPRLTREELLALGDDPALVDTADRAWAEGLDTTQREEIVATAWHGLLARDLARRTETGIQADGRLKFIVEARHGPAWLAVASGDTVLRVHGLDLPEGPYLLLEHRPSPEVANFVGMKSDPGLEAVVTFLLRIVEGDPVTRRLEVFHPEPSPSTQRRILRVGNRRAMMATVSLEGEAGEPTTINPKGLRKELGKMIAGKY